MFKGVRDLNEETDAGQIDRLCLSLLGILHKYKRKVVRRVRITRGDICIAQRPDPVGSDQGGTRPVLIVQNNL